MRETQQDLEDLQSALDDGVAHIQRSANPQLQHIFPSEQAMSAQHLVELFADRRVAALATVNSRGEPRVAPVDILLVRGQFWTFAPASTARVRHLRRNPSVSLTWFDGDGPAVIVHGRANIVPLDAPDIADVEAACREVYETLPRDWTVDDQGQAYIRIQPNLLLTKS